MRSGSAFIIIGNVYQLVRARRSRSATIAHAAGLLRVWVLDLDDEVFGARVVLEGSGHTPLHGWAMAGICLVGTET